MSSTTSNNSSFSWFENVFTELFNPQLAEQKREREKQLEREKIKDKLITLNKKLILQEKQLRKESQKYMLFIKKYKEKGDKRNYIKYIKLYKQCETKLDSISNIIVNVESQILNIKTGESIIDAVQVVDGCDQYFQNLYSDLSPDIIEDKLLNIGDKEVLSSEMETIMSTPYSNGALAVQEDEKDILEFGDQLLSTFDDSPSSGFGEDDLGVKNSQIEEKMIKSLPSCSSSSSNLSVERSKPISKKTSQKKKKLVDMNIF